MEKAPASQTAEVSAGDKRDSADIFFPDPQSVKGRVLGALLRLDTLTHKDCWLRFGSSRLSHHVLMLRKAGWAVEMTWEDVSTSDAGRVAQIGRYWLPHEVIAKAGEHGQLYAAQCARIEKERRATS